MVSPAGLVALGVLLLSAGACSPLAPRTPPAAPPPTTVPGAPTAVELGASIAARAEALASFQGQGRLEYEGPEGDARSANMVVVKAPDNVRIDFRSPFSLMYTVATDGEILVAYDRGEKVMYRGVPSASNIGRFTRVPVTVGSLALLLRGIPPVPAGAVSGSVAAEGELWRWDIPVSSGGKLELLFERGGLLPREVRMEDPTGRSLTARFSEYRSVGGVETAHQIEALLPDGGRVQLHYGVIWRDRQHGDNAFRLEPIAGVRVIELETEADAVSP